MRKRLSSESSASRMRHADEGAVCDWFLAGTAGIGASDSLKATVKKKALPFPTVLSTQIRPPISSTNFFEMERPSPVPPYLRVVEESACVKLSNMDSTLLAGMPM